MRRSWRIAVAAQGTPRGLARRFKLGTKDAFLIPDRLAVYLFQESGEVADAFDREARSIDWGTFSKVTDEVTNLYGDTKVFRDSFGLPAESNVSDAIFFT
jgi:NTP pyrophosphatase (non-canonical NTP hydrolase)